MELGNKLEVGFSTPRPPTLEAVIARLESLSRRPEFVLQREVAFARAFRPYLHGGIGKIVAPLAQETELANLWLLCDFYPEDGQLTLIEQLRDVITEHIPNDERAWLDPLKHSCLDVLESISTPRAGEDLTLQSLGDGSTYVVPGDDLVKHIAVGQAVLTRVIQDPDKCESGKAVWAGCGIVLSQADAKALLKTTAEWRREMEVSSGSFTLGEWKEFAKRFGYMVLWAFAELRMAALADAVGQIRFRRPDGQPYLYAVALYDHHDVGFFADRLSEMREFEVEKATSPARKSGFSDRIWAQKHKSGNGIFVVAKLTLTSSQLLVECDSPERLDQIKHQLAASLGFSLHFRGETLTPPARQLSVTDLMSDEPLKLVVTQEEDRAMLGQFLEKAYLEWPDQPHLALGGHTPRHATVAPTTRASVEQLIDEMERHDPGLLRTGLNAFDYNLLRAHVGLEEKS